ncbi:MAG: sorbitol dehydrogenase [Bryobacteraceae bacterium]|nr:MAG: sorbitol dehydrogenase [Bryobacteraceae bacterium]
MRSVPLVAPRRLELVQAPLPEGPRAGELLLQMRAVGLCGSDLHWWAEGRIHSTPARYPQILGHEPVGEVVAAGAGVQGFRQGDLVSVEPSLTCGHCEFCIAGRHNLCVHARFQGGPEAPGFLRDYAVIPVHNADRVPAGLTVHQATLIEPLAVWVHVFELEPVRLGDTVAVLGAGSIGLLGIAMAKQAGAEMVLAGDRVPHRIELAKRMGADEAVPVRDFRELVMDRTRGRGADLVYDAAGAPETIALGLQCVRPGGSFVLIGIPEPLEFAVDLHAALAKELRIQAIRRSNHKGAQAAALLASGRIPTDLITHRLPLERAQEGFEILHSYADGVGKLIFDFDLKD